MKKIIMIVVLCFFCTSCSSVSKTVHTKLNPSKIEPIQQAAYCTYVFAVCSKEAFYYQSSGGMLFVLDQDGNNIQLGSLNFVDDKPAGSSRNGIPASKYYSEIAGIGVGMQYFDDQLIYESEYSSSDGQIQYHLNSIDKTCSRFQTILSFDYQPSYFTFQNDVIVVAETIAENSGGVVHLYSLDGKEVKEIQEESYVDHLIADQQRVFYTSTESDHTVLKYVDLNDFSDFVMDLNQQTFLFENDNKVSLYTNSMVNDDFMIHSCIQDLDTKEIVFDVNDAIVNYFDDQYIYTSSTNDPDIHYRIYDWNGNLVKEIVPSHAFLGDTYETNNMFWKTNGSQIIRIVDGNIVAVTTKNKEDHLYVCQISDGSCKYVN